MTSICREDESNQEQKQDAEQTLLDCDSHWFLPLEGAERWRCWVLITVHPEIIGILIGCQIIFSSLKAVSSSCSWTPPRNKPRISWTQCPRSSSSYVRLFVGSSRGCPMIGSNGRMILSRACDPQRPRRSLHHRVLQATRPPLSLANDTRVFCDHHSQHTDSHSWTR